MKTLLKYICLLVYVGMFLVGGCIGGMKAGDALTHLTAETLGDADSIPQRFPVVMVLADEKGQQQMMVQPWGRIASDPAFLKKYKVVSYLVPQNQGEYKTGNATRAKFRVTAISADRQLVEIDYSSDIMFVVSLHSRYEAAPDRIFPRYYREVGFWPFFGVAAVFMALVYGLLYFLKLKLVMIVGRQMSGWAPKSTSVLSSLAEATVELIVLRIAKPTQQQPPVS